MKKDTNNTNEAKEIIIESVLGMKRKDINALNDFKQLKVMYKVVEGYIKKNKDEKENKDLKKKLDYIESRCDKLSQVTLELEDKKVSEKEIKKEVEKEVKKTTKTIKNTKLKADNKNKKEAEKEVNNTIKNDDKKEVKKDIKEVKDNKTKKTLVKKTIKKENPYSDNLVKSTKKELPEIVDVSKYVVKLDTDELMQVVYRDNKQVVLLDDKGAMCCNANMFKKGIAQYYDMSGAVMENKIVAYYERLTK